MFSIWMACGQVVSIPPRMTVEKTPQEGRAIQKSEQKRFTITTTRRKLSALGNLIQNVIPATMDLWTFFLSSALTTEKQRLPSPLPLIASTTRTIHYRPKRQTPTVFWTSLDLVKFSIRSVRLTVARIACTEPCMRRRWFERERELASLFASHMTPNTH